MKKDIEKPETNIVSFRIKSNEYDLLKKLAASDNRTIGGYLRNMLKIEFKKQIK